MKSSLSLFVILTLLSCSKTLEGVYYYTEVPQGKGEGALSELFAAGREFGCSMIGTFEFKNGMCYFQLMGTDYRSAYDIDEDMIYLRSGIFNQEGVGIKIMDINTLSYSGCIFKKIDLSTIYEANTNATVNLRSGPATSYEKLETLEKGTELYVLESSEYWVKVRVGWREGYIHKDFVSLNEK